MIFVFYFFAAVLLWLSFKSFRGGFEYLRVFRTELAKPRSTFTPFATVIVPCRGLDAGMYENLGALFEQDYPEYEIVFAVDDAADSAASVIEEVSCKSANDAKRSRLIIAPKAVDCGQKVENLRESVLHVSAKSMVFVFVDSDARPSKDWLASLVSPLASDNVGASTGYRWFISKDPSFGSELRSVWNASIASALGPNTKSNFCWGGSMAIRRDVFERVDMREKWHGTLSDDFAVTRAMKAANLPIVFVPQALTASVENCSLRETLEFTTRQMKITRVYAMPLWLVSLVGSALFNAVMLTAALIVILNRTNSLPVWVSLAVLFFVSFFSVGKAWLRLNAVRLVLTDYDSDLKRQFWTQNTMGILSPALFFVNSVAAWLSRRMTWRGTRYELKSPSKTVIIRD